MKSKRGLILGGFITDFIMIIFVISLLLIFFLFSGVVKTIDKSEGGIKIAKEGEIGLSGIDDYMAKNYPAVLNLRVKNSLEESRLGEKNEK